MQPTPGVWQLRPALGPLAQVDRAPAGGDAPAAARVALTYVTEGSLVWRGGILRAGEFHQQAAGEVAGFAGSAALMRLWFDPGTPQGGCARRFCVGDRKGRLRLVAAPDGAGGAIRLGAAARVYSAVLEPGQHVVHPLHAGRTAAWLLLLRGRAQLSGDGEDELEANDTVILRNEAAVSITAIDPSELVLVETPEEA